MACLDLLMTVMITGSKESTQEKLLIMEQKWREYMKINKQEIEQKVTSNNSPDIDNMVRKSKTQINQYTQIFEQQTTCSWEKYR